MNFASSRCIHFIGIGGISVSAAARLARHLKKEVSGSDVAQSVITEKLAREGINIAIGHRAEHVGPRVDLVVYSEAVPQENPERAAAAGRGIRHMSVFEFWGAYAEHKKVIAVSGTNGKSTTTAMLGYILAEAGFDPTVVVGTEVLAWKSNIRIGTSDWFVVEADEYAGHMHAFKPYLAVITNIAPDHLDFYKDINDIKNNFERWLGTVAADGGVVLNAGDPVSRTLALRHSNVRWFGSSASDAARASGIVEVTDENGWDGIVQFNIVDNREDWGWTKLKLPGRHNVENALAAAIAADALRAPRKKILRALDNFTGTWRRFERVGFYRGALVISDYGHHPDGIRATIRAARGWYPFKRIVLLYQPHQHNRTKNLFNDFVASFDGVDELILAEIYDVAGREEASDQSVSSRDLVEAIPGARYAPDLAAAERMVREIAREGDILIVMGAGDVDAVARNLIR